MVVTTLKILRVYNPKNFAYALCAIFLSPPIQKSYATAICISLLLFTEIPLLEKPVGM